MRRRQLCQGFEVSAPSLSRETTQTFVALLRSIVARRGASAAKVAIAWMLSRKPWIVPLFGTRNVERFKKNVGALSVVLSNDQLSEIQVGAAAIAVEGARYPEAMLRRSGL